VSLRAGVARGQAVAAIVDAIDAISCPHPVRVAIDGSAAAGKTMLADELAISLRGRGRDVIRASVEGFLRPRIERYRRGSESARGCYEDSFDYDRLLAELLRPLGESGSRFYRTEIYDRHTDLRRDAEQMEASADAILLFDGVFLLRPELVDAWDFRVFITVASEEIIRRARIRDAEVYGSPDDAERRFRARYLPSQRHYRGTVRPAELADVVLDNDDPSQPSVLMRT
jgi:uridine kinase